MANSQHRKAVSHSFLGVRNFLIIHKSCCHRLMAAGKNYKE